MHDNYTGLDLLKGLLIVFGLSAGGSLMFYTWLIYMPSHVQTQYHVSASSSLLASLIAQCCFLIILPLMGMAGDRFGRRPFVIAFGALFVILTIPLYSLLRNSFSSLLIVLLVALFILAILFGVNGAVWAEVFPTRFRAAGVSGALSTSTAIFGGTAPYINTYLSEHGHQDWFMYYLITVAGVTLITGLLMKETKGVEL